MIFITKLFEGLDDDFISTIFSEKECYTSKYLSGDVIFSKDKFERAIGIINSGCAIVKNYDDGGVIIKYLSNGDCFGVAALFSEDSKYVSEIVADTECSVTFIPESVILSYVEKSPEMSINYIKFLTDKIRYLNILLDAYSSSTVVMKLAKFLNAKQNGSGVPIGFTLTELSKILGIGRASLYRALDELSSKGIIEKKGKIIVITNSQRLKEFVENPDEIRRKL